jgi:hypothetical protein
MKVLVVCKMLLHDLAIISDQAMSEQIISDILKILL